MKLRESVVLSFVVCCVLFGSVSVWGIFEGESLTIGDKNGTGVAPYFYATLDAAGYSDWIWYGSSPEHDWEYHEILSGEYGAAIYYDGIDLEQHSRNQRIKIGSCGSGVLFFACAFLLAA